MSELETTQINRAEDRPPNLVFETDSPSLPELSSDPLIREIQERYRLYCAQMWINGQATRIAPQRWCRTFGSANTATETYVIGTPGDAATIRRLMIQPGTHDVQIDRRGILLEDDTFWVYEALEPLSYMMAMAWHTEKMFLVMEENVELQHQEFQIYSRCHNRNCVQWDHIVVEHRSVVEDRRGCRYSYVTVSDENPSHIYSRCPHRPRCILPVVTFGCTQGV